MAPLPVILGVCRVTLNWTSDGAETAKNVLHFRPVANSAAIDDLHQYLDDAWNTAGSDAHCWDFMSSNATLLSADYTLLDGLSGTVHKTFTPGTIPAHPTTGNIIPAGCADVSLATANRGKSYRGRIYAPFCSEGAQQHGQITAGIVTAMQAAWDDFPSHITGVLGVNLCVASYTLATATPVTTATVRPFMATQRRRQSRLNSY